MLVISRKKQQQVLMPELDIEIVIVRVSGNTVTLGIKAPDSVPILRGELCRREVEQHKLVTSDSSPVDPLHQTAS